MVIKGSARAGPGELAYHLLRADTNETVRVLGYSDVSSNNLRDALFELDAMGAGSRSRRTLYHASINTPVSEQLTPEQQRLARERLAMACGLQSQPYAVVEHVKKGRQHIHVVWSRIDPETARAIPDSHNYRRHETVSRELEREFGHTPVLGAHVRDKTAEPRPERGPSWGEQRQAERSGVPVAEAKRIVSQCWQETDTGQAFKRKLEEAGFTLARGDRREFLLVDRAGEVHGLTRRLQGVKAAGLRERLEDVDPESLPDVDTARRRLKTGPDEAQPQPEFAGTAERIRAAERLQESSGSRQVLSGFNGEIADAIRRLNRTDRASVEQTIVSRPHAAARQEIQDDIRSRIEPARPSPAFDPRFAREVIGPPRPARPEPPRPEPKPTRPPPVDPAHAREETNQASSPSKPAPVEQPKRSLAEELREQLGRARPGRSYGRGF